MESLSKKYSSYLHLVLIKNLFHRVLIKIRRIAYEYIWTINSLLRPTYELSINIKTEELVLNFDFLTEEFYRKMAGEMPDFIEVIENQSTQLLKHNFNLLGSGVVNIKHGMECSGFGGYKYFSSAACPDKNGNWLQFSINKKNIPIAKKLWNELSPNYIPIDWQIDFKSGYRWSEKKSYFKVKFGKTPGVDIKVPWELSRMQHLPVLALAYGFSKNGRMEFCDHQAYYLEIRNQVFDFMATNPPGFGVNWVCTMDVSIRLVNLLIAYDILKSSGLPADYQFEMNLTSFITAHAIYISNNLEWHQTYRGNHYLSNLAGLIFAGAYLSGDRANKWLEFGAKEFISETLYQFNPDGSNFESSTSYHRLSSEIVMWSTGLILRNDYFSSKNLSVFNKDYIPSEFWSRVLGMANFTEALSDSNGLIAQFGDNDSGRFVSFGSGEKLRAFGDVNSPHWSLDHCGLVAGILTLLGREVPIDIQDVSSIFIKSMTELHPKIEIKQEELFLNSYSNDDIWINFSAMHKSLPVRNKWITNFLYKGDGDLALDLNRYAFTGMGCFIFKRKDFFLAVKCGPIGLSGLGAHDHFDQLSIVLHMNDEYILRDPGSYIYTALTDVRQIYRSHQAHNGPKFIGIENYCKPRGVFDLRGSYPAECIYFGPKGLIGKWNIGNNSIYRMIVIKSWGIKIVDFSNAFFEMKNPIVTNIKYSQGYGQLMT